MSRRRSHCPGYALIAVLGLLASMGGLATLFLRLCVTEQATAASHLALVRARMTAQSGIDYAVAELRTTRIAPDGLGTSPLARRQAWSDIRDAWVYGDAVNAPHGPRAFGVPPPPVGRAIRPSFPAGTVGSVRVSGPVPPNPDGEAEWFVLRVTDCASRIHVNDRNASLGRVLDNLGELLGVRDLGGTILRSRPAEGYAEMRDLRDRAFRGARVSWERVRDFLTCHAWVDRSTVRWSSQAPRWRPEPRAPVNVNTACTEVLTALLWGIEAEYPVRDPAAGVVRNSRAGPLGRETARRLAEHIVAQRTRFGDGRWAFNDWMHFCIEVIDTADFLTQPEKDLVKADLNPGSDVKKLAPDRILVDPNPDTDPREWTRIDKSDLTVSGTEACFSSMGYYEIESLGRVWDGRRVVAEQRIVAVARLFELVRATTQQDFETDREWHDARFGALASAEGYPAVVSGPEYPYAPPGGFRTPGAPWAAPWDGHLQLSGVVRVKAASWPVERSSWLAGFNSGHLRPDLSPTSDAPRTFLDPIGPWGTVASARVLPSVVAGAGGARAFFSGGSDLLPFGAHLDALERGRVVLYRANDHPAARGSVEFLVKPETGYDRLPAGREETLFQWSNGGSYNYTELRVYATRGRVWAEWRFAGSGMPVPTDRRAVFGAVDWTPHTWHHLEVDWDEDATRLFLDGSPAGAMATPGVAPAFANLQALPPWIALGGRVVVDWIPAARLHPAIMVGDQARNLAEIRRVLVRGAAVRAEATATFDNVCVHPFVQHREAFIPRSRFHDRSYRPYTASGAGPGGSDAAVGVYKKLLREIMDAAREEPVVLGAVCCTHYHPYHEHREGHDAGAGSYGHITPGVVIEGESGYRHVHAYDGGAGVPLGIPVRSGERVSFLAEFEVSDRLPVMESPILCDFTVTYMRKPAFLAWEMTVEP